MTHLKTGHVFLKKIYDFILDIFFKKDCLGCGREGEFVCQDCWSLLPVIKGVACFGCGRRSPDGRVCPKCKKKKSPALAGLFVCSDWNNSLLRQIIYNYKYRFVRELSVPLSQLMISFLKNSRLADYSGDRIILIPVPLHPRRFSWRGFNQSFLLASRIAGHFAWQVDEKIIRRIHFTPPQVGIKEEKSRRRNITGAFNLIKKDSGGNEYSGKIFVLVDDLSTTGATLEECARVLKKLDPQEIWGLVAARG